MNLSESWLKTFTGRFIVSGECFLWTERLDTDGYGRICHFDKDVRVHRLSWELQHGMSAEGICVLHTCDVRNCINPEHLFDGDRTDNAEDKTRKGRVVSGGSIGESHGMSKLIPPQVIELRAKWATGMYTKTMLAEEYNITKQQVARIVNRESWSHI